ncbi:MULTISPECIES: Fe(2+) transporter permease subunit FeoB [Alphaproteobacteria]|uniref:Ferrous iron transport protein B n=2 Tax=Alphaproteobacteria TaxID=28211 RepID=A0A512HG22_9HYPH|nr:MULTISPECIES: Fe(2+) transporter permease subunit FeoB [Alphaproteobacteria]GEO84402.1 ferrous iron transport protein B [Ciceribacter naphthalenivorans]GLR22365.1 ferrous iron transport protein B [Ciceribacter naphthalenivorans]GLT05221.1 ferrous iron transport protein B [Sphingomonas psychrolutea]
MNQLTAAVVGNPNCGKTTLFNALTGSRQKVGNWPGVTVEKKTGTMLLDDKPATLVDLPGTYSLGSAETSLDERIALDYAISGAADVLINIVDASNLERHLYLTTQLLEMRVPMLVVLNMMDVARQNGISIDVDALAAHLGCPVVPVAAAKGTGLEEMKRAIAEVAASRAVPHCFCHYDAPVEKAVTRFASRLPDASVDRRWQLIQIFDGDHARLAALPSDLAAEIGDCFADLEEACGEDLDILIADRRYAFAGKAVAASVERPREASRSMTDRIDRVVLHRVLGIPIFLAIMYLMFMWTINVGSAFIDFFDIGVGAVLVDGLGHAMRSAGSPDWLVVLLADGVGGGIRTVATFIPIIAFLYIFLSILEDSGYLARAAFVMDRFMRMAGLPGKAFVPLIVGFGCNVPAIMGTRTLDNDSDRKTAIMMAPFMSCGARLPVYALFAAAFFPTNGQNLVFGLYITGIAVAILTGYLMKMTVTRGHSSPLVMELPPYHLPRFRNVVLHTWERLKGFVLSAGRVIVLMVAFLSFVNAMDTEGNFGTGKSDASLLAAASRAAAPVFHPMGLDEGNWPAIVGIVTGVFAKEAVVGTLDSLYGALARDAVSAAPQEQRTTLQIIGNGLKDALASIPTNLAAVAGKAVDPLGLDIGHVNSPDAAAAEQAVEKGTFSEMQARFSGAAGAFAYMLFILLYTPCVAATGAIYREAGARWMMAALAWTTGIAYGAAVIAYQIATFDKAPLQAAGWIAGVIAAFALTVATLRYNSARPHRTLAVTTEGER